MLEPVRYANKSCTDNQESEGLWQNRAMFESLLKLAGNAVKAPIALVADVVTLGGLLTDRDEAYTATNLEDTLRNLEDLIDGDRQNVH